MDVVKHFLIKEGQGGLRLFERMVVALAHRGHGLGLFIIEAADTVINGHMSAQIVKPFPLQFESNAGFGFPAQTSESYGFPDPPGETEGLETAFLDAQAKICSYYARLGFQKHGNQFMLRWNGYKNPPLRQAMRK